MPGIARFSAGDFRQPGEQTRRNSPSEAYAFWISFDIGIHVFGAAGFLYWFAHHNFAPCAVPVVKLHQPPAVASIDARFFGRLIATVHHRPVDAPDIESANTHVMPDAELLRRGRAVVFHHVL